MRSRLCGLCLAWCLMAPAMPAAAQETVNTASVSGRVVDPQGAVIPGASVVAREIETNISRETATDREGRFRFPYLKVGRYDITVHLEGFGDARRTLALTAGAAFELPISLLLATLDTTVTVTGEVTALETARSQIAGTINETEVRNLP